MNKYIKLFLCILIDIIGLASYIIPGFGEIIIDVIWAPLSSYLLSKLFPDRVGRFFSIINFIEELLPFTDFIPTATILWFYYYFKKSNNKTIFENQN